MALKMAQPQRHPKTGVFRFRRVVPPDLRALLGKTEELISLGTKDAAEARVRYAKISAEVEARWANLRKAPQTLTEREAFELAEAVHDGWLDRHRDNPSEPTGWRTDLYDQLWTEPARWDMDQPMEVRFRDLAESVGSPAREQEKWCVAQADRVLSERGLRVDQVGRTKLARAVAGAVQRACLTLNRAARGDFDDLTQRTISQSSPLVDRRLTRTPSTKARALDPTSLTVSGLVEAWWAEAKAAGLKTSTYESYANTARYFVAFLQHDDATRVTAEDVVAFKNHRLSTPSPRTGKIPTAKTVKDSDLSALKTLFGWAVSNRKMADNPATGITIKVRKPQRLRSKGFTEAEAHAILSAALNYVPGREHSCLAAAKRWVPWLCAFSGARVGEIAQLRKQDVRREGDLWIMHITPEAYTVKNGQARDVVLHSQLIELGFPAFVEERPDGYLFMNIGKPGNIRGAWRTTKNKLADFARAIVSDRGVLPNHGWRHRFKTIGMEADIAPRILDAIQGQAPRTVADTYGDVTTKTRANAISKLPSFDMSVLRRHRGNALTVTEVQTTAMSNPEL